MIRPREADDHLCMPRSNTCQAFDQPVGWHSRIIHPKVALPCGQYCADVLERASNSARSINKASRSYSAINQYRRRDMTGVRPRYEKQVRVETPEERPIPEISVCPDSPSVLSTPSISERLKSSIAVYGVDLRGCHVACP